MRHPLDGIRVLDLSRVLAGPYCTMMLGDLGADVIKVEQPGVGDDTRRWGPPWVGGESAYYMACNRNKRGITVNLKDERGKAIIRELARQSDIVVENFKVGALDRMGLGYEALSALNPGLIWCSITGYGQDGPYAERAGYDVIAQGEGGIMSITGEPDGEPMKVGVAIVDITTGMFACNAILAALRVRDQTGKGQRIDMALLASAVAWLANVGSAYLLTGELPQRYGNAHPNLVPYQTFKARDRWMTVGVGNDRQFQTLCRILGLEHLATDERFATNPARVEHRDTLIPILQEAFATRDADDWLAELSAAGIPCGPINTLDRVFAHPQILHRQMVHEVPHPTIGSVRLAGPPYIFSETPATVRSHPPLLGEHTDEVLRERLGYTEAQIAELRAAGVV
ncbi:MAG: CaiB/BaiF CoA-transferase family protein [Sphaerobacter sp.]|nr:CaiB/BaiF CoA-transferase family protein [Sphaerobacter sp.]